MSLQSLRDFSPNHWTDNLARLQHMVAFLAKLLAVAVFSSSPSSDLREQRRLTAALLMLRDEIDEFLRGMDEV